jgi:cytochrome P450
LIGDYGFTGGRDGFRAFCATVFKPGAPRFLRTPDDNLVVFRHADLRALGALPDMANVPPALLFGSVPADCSVAQPEPGQGIPTVISNQFFTANPPLHGPLRLALLRQLGPKQVGGMEELARATTQRILDALGGGQEIDLVRDVAEQLTLRFWAALIGLTEAEISELALCVRDLSLLFLLDRSAEEGRRLDDAARRYHGLILGAAERSLSAGGHPFVAALAEELAAIPFEDDPATTGIVPRNVGAFLSGNLIDGFHTATVAAANTLHVLLRQPETLAAVKASPALLDRAVFEALRLEPPVLALKRWVRAPILYDGMQIPQDTIVTLFWAAGNHDPSAFATPDRFDLARPHHGVTTFGTGAHICPGRYVALMLARVLLERIEANGIDFDPPDAAGDWIGNSVMGQLKTMKLRMQRRRPADQPPPCRTKPETD